MLKMGALLCASHRITTHKLACMPGGAGMGTEGSSPQQVSLRLPHCVIASVSYSSMVSHPLRETWPFLTDLAAVFT